MTTSTLAPAPLISRHQLFRAGVHGAASVADCRRLVAEGLVRRVFADVFVAVDVADSRRLRAAAAALLVPARHQADRSWVVAFASAAWLLTGRWGVPPPDDDLLHSPEPAPVRPGPGDRRLEVIIGAGRNRPADPWVQGRQARLAPSEITLVHGLPVSDPVRTAADVARELPLAAALEQLLLLEEFSGVTPEAVRRRLEQMRYSRGVARARATITAWQER